jgi:cyclopropane fatty-acyl-phospholipid synthase-like methyltransferase
MNGLDLYAKVEHLFDFEYVMDFLWGKYIEELKKLNVKTILDIGCGTGGFMLKAKEAGFEVVGIDISEEMINLAKEKDLEVYHKDLCEFSGKFDACVAIFDVINYMDDEYLKNFFKCVKNVLKKDGYFLFDVNTFYGFDEIAQGTISVEDEENFAVLNSIFEDDEMVTKITLFEKNSKCYEKQESEIIQYFHKNQKLKKLNPLKFDKKIEINLYDGDMPDKEVLIFKQK